MNFKTIDIISLFFAIVSLIFASIHLNVSGIFGWLAVILLVLERANNNNDKEEIEK